MSVESKLVEYISKKSPYLKVCKVNIDSIRFEERVRLQCFHCEKYEQKWTCPPRINVINFEKVFNEYENAMVVYCEIPYKNEAEYAIVRTDSTNLIHKTLLEMEKILYRNNEVFAMSFIGGSCKLCKDGCSDKKCRFPHLSRIPLEATGINVIDFVKREVNFDIKFPLDRYMYRFGMLLW